MTLYAIGDIHGQLDKLRAAHALITADRAAHDTKDAPVVHLGDYVDRGPDSAGVIDYLIAGHARGEPWICLKGNHDRIFLNYLTRGATSDHVLRKGLSWLDAPMGGTETLASYGVTRRRWTSAGGLLDHARKAVPPTHLEFLTGLHLSHQTGDLFLCHAGIRPDVPLNEQSEDDLIWIRSPFLESTTDHGKLIVHGHTPVEMPKNHGNRVALDTGAGFGRDLTAAAFEGRSCHILTETGRVPLQPA